MKTTKAVLNFLKPLKGYSETDYDFSAFIDQHNCFKRDLH